MATQAIVTLANVGVPEGVAPLNLDGAVPVAYGGTGVSSLPEGALRVDGGVVVGGVLPQSAGGTGTTTSTGTGANVLSTGASLTAPNISGGAINGTSLGAIIPVTVNASSITVQQLSVAGMTMTSTTGTGSMVLSNSPTLINPNLGTPNSVNLTNATALPLASGVTGVLPVANGGTGVSTLTGLVKANGTGAFSAAVAGTDYLNPSIVGQPNGLATLGADGKLTATQIPDSLMGALNYQGTWDADTNVPTLASGVGSKGHYYKVSVEGSTDLDGITTWNLGDLAIFDGNVWGKVDGVADQVLSVNGMTGSVIITRQLLGAATAGANSDITSLDGLTTPLSTVQGGTGVTTATGTGANVLATSPVLVTPDLGTPSAVDLANATGLPLATGVTGVLSYAQGGTGESSRQAALNSLAASTADGLFLRGDGTNVSLAPIQASDVPTLNQNTTGTASAVTNAAQPAVTSLGTLTNLNVGGALSLTSDEAPVVLDGDPGVAGQYLVSNGPGATPSWYTLTTAGTVTSVNAEGGTTGLSFAGGPITGSGTLTMGGVLATAHGGTGSTTATGTGSVVLAESPVLITPNIGTPSVAVLTNATGLSLVSGVTDVLGIAHGGTGQTTASAGRIALGAAASGANSDITQLSGLTTPLSVAQGGTGTNNSTGSGNVVLANSPNLTGTTSVGSISIGTSAAFLGTTAPLVLNGSAGVNGQVLTSSGPGATPTWTTPVTSGTVTSVDVAGGVTGLTFSGGPIHEAGTLTMSGVLVASSGGTGLSTYAPGDLIYAASTNSLAKLPAVASGNVLLSAGTGTAPSYGKVNLATHVTGTLPAANGGTGTTTSTGTGANVLGTNPTIANPAITGGSINSTPIGNTSAAAGTFTTLAANTSLALASACPILLNGSAGTAGQVLTSAGASGTPTWTAAGTVSSVSASGGTTGLTFSGGPITSTGTLTLGGTLAVANGGTGVTTSTGSGNNVLSAGPTFTGTANFSAATVASTFALAGTAAPVTLNGSAGIAGQVLTSAGPGATPTWTSTAGTGTVTSVAASGGSTGLTFSGGPITSSGTLVLSGVLAVTAGGTGTSTSTGSGSNVLSASPTLSGTVNVSSLTAAGTLTLAGSTSPVVLNSSAGTAGQVLTSAGPGATPYWAAGGGTGTVTSVAASGGSTGLTFTGGPITSNGTLVLSGTLAVANGGTGTTTSTGTGSVVLSGSPTFTGTATAATLAVNTALSMAGTESHILLNGAAGTPGQVLVSGGPGATPNWASVGAGTVTSVNVAGGSTGLTFSGGPVTSSGVITAGGTLSAANGGTGLSSYVVGDLMYASGTATLSKLAGVAIGNVLLSGGVGSAPSYGKVNLTTHVTGALPVASGGTGATTVTGTGANVLATSPVLVTPDLGTPSAVNLSNATALPLSSGVTGVLPVANGGTGVSTATGTGSVVRAASPTLTGTTTMAAASVSGGLTLSGAAAPMVLGSSAGLSGQVLTSAGPGATPYWSAGGGGSGSGTVTSVDVSGGTTGLTFSGGPVTTSGTITLSGQLAVANGGTGTTTSVGSGSNVLSDSPDFTGTATFAGLDTLSLSIEGDVGLSGQVLTSAGPGFAPQWTSVVESFSCGTTGLTPATATRGAVTLGGTLAVANGGTGVTTSTGSGANVLGTNPYISGLAVSTANSVTAGGNSQGSATLTSDFNVVTVAPVAPSGVTLPTAVSGRRVVVVNRANNPIVVYPAVGGIIDAHATNDPVTVPIGAMVQFMASSTTQWQSTLVSAVNASSMTGVLPVAAGGTGTTNATGTGNVVLSDSPILTGTTGMVQLALSSTLTLGSNAPISLGGSTGVSGQVLTSAGPGVAPTWTTPVTGSVSSVDASGGTTGLTFTGGPITSAGTLTLGGILATINGGTGVTSSTGSGSNVLSANPTFTGTVTMAGASVTAGLTMNGTTNPLVVRTSPGAAGDYLMSNGVGSTPSWAPFSTTLLNTSLSGLSISWNEPITSSDNVITAFGKLQSQLTAHIGAGGAAHPVASTTVAGFMSAADKTKLNSVPASFGTAAQKNTGTSGDAVPLLNGANTWSAVQTMSEGARAKYVHFGGGGYYNAGNSGSAKTIDFANGQKQVLTLTANCTITLTAPGPGNYQLLLAQDSTGGRSVTWASQGGIVAFVGSSTAPAINTAVTSYTMVSLFFDGVTSGNSWLTASKVNA